MANNQLQNQASNYKVLSSNMQDLLLQKCSDRYRVIILLMLDAGLRVTEASSLKIGHIDSFQKVLRIQSLKKRGEKSVREIPMTDRLVDAIVTYFPKLKSKKANDFLFPTNSKTGHLSRKRVWARIKKYSDGLVHPHMLRHTFATRIVNQGNDFQALQSAQKMLGHNSITTTEIYTHVSREQTIQAIRGIEQKSIFDKILSQFFPKKQLHIVQFDKGFTKFHIGRKAELKRLIAAGNKKINTIILGPQGIGKTHLLDNYNIETNFIIRIDEMTNLKKMFAGLLLELIQRHPERAEFLLNNRLSIVDANGNLIPEEKIGSIILRQSVKFTIEDLIAITKKQEYTLIIDDLTRVTPTGVASLEKIKNHFHLLAAARTIPITKATFLSNFERIDLNPLSRPETVELISKLSKQRGLLDRIEDWESYKNHIWENTEGIPLYIYEMVERYAKETELNEAIVKDIRHTAAKKEVSILPFLVAILACFSVMRYWGKITGTDSGPWYFIAAIGVLFLFFGRSIVQSTKRKYV